MRIVCFIVILITLNITNCFSQNYITENQAQQAIRNYENNQNILFKNGEIKELNNSDLGNYSVWRIPVKSSENEYMVRAISGEVCAAIYIDRYPIDDYDQPFNQVSSQNAALAYARLKYANFDSMGFQLEQSKWEGTHWLFLWNQILSYNAKSMNNIRIQIDPKNLQIINYSSDRFSVANPNQPQITSTQAINTAKTETGISTINNLTGPTLLVLPNGSVRWDIVIEGTKSDGINCAYFVTINAETGDLIDKTEAMLKSKKEKKSSDVSKTKNIKKKNIKTCKKKVEKKASASGKISNTLPAKKNNSMKKTIIHE